jgi:hypothetical protein
MRVQMKNNSVQHNRACIKIPKIAMHAKKMVLIGHEIPEPIDLCRLAAF